SLPPATCRTESTARPSPALARVAWQPLTRSDGWTVKWFDPRDGLTPHREPHERFARPAVRAGRRGLRTGAPRRKATIVSRTKRIQTSQGCNGPGATASFPGTRAKRVVGSLSDLKALQRELKARR